MTPQVAERHETYVTAFDAFRRDPVFGPEPLQAARQAAFDRFLLQGFPTTRNEDWRFTNVAPIADTPFVRPAVGDVPAAAALAPYLFANVPTILLVNGRLVAGWKGAPPLPAGVRVAKGTTPEGAGFGTGNAFADLNAAFFDEAVVIEIAAKHVVDAPLHILSIVLSAERPAFVSPRVIVTVGEGAQVSIVESYAGLGTGTTLTNAVTEYRLGPEAVVDHVKLQRETPAAFHVANVNVHLERASTFTSYSLTFGGRLTRNDIVAVLAGEGAECTLDGLYIADRDSVVDNHTTIDHASPHCPSHEVYKGILGGKARAVFNGKIIVRPDAQKTDAKQTNKALLLSDDAQINTKPQLEIFADDVRCTHGAAIGQLDDDALFYLRARGIAEADARSLLIHAFAGDVLDGIKVPAVRDRARQLMEERLELV